MSSLRQIQYAHVETHFLSSKHNAPPIFSVSIVPPTFSPLHKLELEELSLKVSGLS